MNTLWFCFMKDIDYSHVTAELFPFDPFVSVLFYGHGIVYLISPILSAWKFPSGNYSPFKINVAEGLIARFVSRKPNLSEL